MKKVTLLIVMVIALGSNVAKAQFDAGAMIPYLSAMVDNLSRVNGVLEESEENLKGIQKTLGTIKNAQEFFRHAVAVREAINLTVCLIQNLTDNDMRKIFDIAGANESNLFSDFMTCQYDIYYSTLNIDFELIESNIERAFDPTEELNIVQRIDLVLETVRMIENIRYRTVSAKGTLLSVLQDYMDVAIAEEFLTVMNKL